MGYLSGHRALAGRLRKRQEVEAPRSAVGRGGSTGLQGQARICDRKSLVRSSVGFVKKCSGVPTSTI